MGTNLFKLAEINSGRSVCVSPIQGAINTDIKYVQ